MHMSALELWLNCFIRFYIFLSSDQLKSLRWGWGTFGRLLPHVSDVKMVESVSPRPYSVWIRFSQAQTWLALFGNGCRKVEVCVGVCRIKQTNNRTTKSERHPLEPEADQRFQIFSWHRLKWWICCLFLIQGSLKWAAGSRCPSTI